LQYSRGGNINIEYRERTTHPKNNAMAIGGYCYRELITVSSLPDAAQADIILSAVTVYERHEVVWIVPRTGNGKRASRQGRQEGKKARRRSPYCIGEEHIHI
jgi:hypothetical protein